MKIDEIIIVGGGSSGWMAASTLIRKFPDKKISLVESPDIKTVGVGESTVAGINNWMQMIGINDVDFMKDCDAVYKLSIAFEDFYRKDYGRFHYPFGQPSFLYVQENPLNTWFIKKILYPDTPVSEYADCVMPTMGLIQQNRITRKLESIPDFHFTNDTAYQFDATKFGIWLRDNVCIPEGVNHIKGNVIDAKVNENGIEHIELEDKKYLTADLFIDCTGFRSVLLERTMGTEWIPYDHIIPNNKAWATHIPYTDKEKQIVLYTLCTAIENGWTWEIPLWSSIGAGYVYSDRFITEANALLEFQQQLTKQGYKDVEKLDYHSISMRIGRHEKAWVKNVCSIGLSFGFIEPLESNGLYTTHENLYTLTRVLEREYTSQWDINTFNARAQVDFDTFAEFVALQYTLGHRDDTEYWREIGNRNWADLLEPMMRKGFNTAFNEKFRDGYWINEDRGGLHFIATGLNYFPASINNIQYMTAKHDIKQDIKQLYEAAIIKLDKRREHWQSIAAPHPTHYQYLKDTIYHDSE